MKKLALEMLWLEELWWEMQATLGDKEDFQPVQHWQVTEMSADLQTRHMTWKNFLNLTTFKGKIRLLQSSPSSPGSSLDLFSRGKQARGKHLAFLSWGTVPSSACLPFAAGSAVRWVSVDLSYFNPLVLPT